MDSLELLNRANEEIKTLRHQNELMSARLTMFDDVMLILNACPIYKSSGLMHPDIVHEIDRAIKDNENKSK